MNLELQIAIDLTEIVCPKVSFHYHLMYDKVYLQFHLKCTQMLKALS